MDGQMLRQGVGRAGPGIKLVWRPVPEKRGAAGQAVQALNILFGIDEQTGLAGAALLP